MEKKIIKRRRWTTAEIDYLKENYENTEISIQEMADYLGRSAGTVGEMARILGLSKYDLWSEEQEEYLKSNYERKDVSQSDMCNYLGKNRDVIRWKATRMGLSRTRFKVTQNDIDFILSSELKIKDIATHLGISISLVNTYLAKYDVKRNNGGRMAVWTDEQIEYVKANYENKSVSMQEIMNHLGKSKDAIRQKANILGLSRSRKKQ